MKKKCTTYVFVFIAVVMTPLFNACAEPSPPVALPQEVQPPMAVEEPELPPETEAVLSPEEQAAVDNIREDLKKQGVPVISVKVFDSPIWNPPRVIEFVMQSPGTSDEAIQKKVKYTTMVNRAGNMAFKRGLYVGAIREMYIGSQGSEGVSVNAIHQIENTEAPTTKPPTIADGAITGLLRKELSFDGLEVAKLELSTKIDGSRWLTFDVVTPDLETANNIYTAFFSKLGVTVRDLNNLNNAGITGYSLDITTASGKKLLTLTRDLELGSQHWWQDTGFTQDWFPHPPPVLPKAN